MQRMSLKIVPNTAPDAEGRWVQAEFPAGLNPIRFVNIQGHHVVQTAEAFDIRDGGPMHKMADPMPPADRLFDQSWLVAA